MGEAQDRGGPRLIAEEAAAGPVAEVFEEARAVLRSTAVPDLLRALAVWPGLLSAAWARLAPNLRTRFFEQSADRLRIKAADDAAAVVGRALAGAPWEWEPPEEARRLVAGHHYLYPKLLLAAAALGEALRGEEPGAGPLAKEALSPLPLGAPEGMAELAPPPQAALAPEARALLDRARPVLEAPLLPELFVSLARWPRLLQDVWDLWGTARGLETYRAQVADLAEFARRQAFHLPYPVALSREEVLRIGYPPAEVAAAVGYFEGLLPQALFLAAALAVLLWGHTASRASPYPVPE